MKKSRFTGSQISRGIEGRRSGSAGGVVDPQARHQRGEVQGAGYRAAFHPAWQARPECLHRALQPTYREEVSSAYLFNSLEEVREITAEWLERYNEITPHDALGSLPPARYRERLLAAKTPAELSTRRRGLRTIRQDEEEQRSRNSRFSRYEGISIVRIWLEQNDEKTAIAGPVRGDLRR
jgi:hypothetical protein